LPLLRAAEEEAAVRAEVVPHLERDLEVAVRLVGDQDAAAARLVLAAHDRAVLDDPPAARAVARLLADVPAGQRLAVEDGLETRVRGLRGRRRGRGGRAGTGKHRRPEPNHAGSSIHRFLAEGEESSTLTVATIRRRIVAGVVRSPLCESPGLSASGAAWLS